MHDIVVIGGGPAGLCAALYALRNNKTVLLLEKQGFGGQITYSPKVENFPGTMQMSGNEFAERFLDQVIAQGAELELETAVQVLDEGATKRVLTQEGGDYPCKAVVLATGVKHRMLGLEGESALVGSGVSFCAVCDGEFYRDQTVVVVGGGNSALQEASLLSENCRRVILVQDLPVFTGERRSQDSLFARPNVEAHTGTVVDALLSEGGSLQGVRVRKQATGETWVIPCQGLFIAIGLIPENERFRGVAALDQYGYLDSGENCLTATPGVFAAGDCRRKGLRQLTTAVADGAVAAVAACRYIDGL